MERKRLKLYYELSRRVLLESKLPSSKPAYCSLRYNVASFVFVVSKLLRRLFIHGNANYLTTPRAPRLFPTLVEGIVITRRRETQDTGF